jgi:hypothetical protein
MSVRCQATAQPTVYITLTGNLSGSSPHKASWCFLSFLIYLHARNDQAIKRSSDQAIKRSSDQAIKNQTNPSVNVSTTRFKTNKKIKLNLTIQILAGIYLKTIHSLRPAT